MTSGTNIFASQYVAIQDKAELLLGTGTGSRGYGQTLQSSDVFVGNMITKAQWDALRYDIINIRFHQDGVLPNIVTVNVGDVIGYGAAAPNTNYDTLLEQASANRFAIDGSQSVITSKATELYSLSWTSQAQATLTCTFSNSDEARFFFNSGGKIRFTTTLTGGSLTSQVNAWRNFLTSVGTRSFGADTGGTVTYYTLTNSYQTFYQSSLSTPYSANNYKLEARCNVANNSTGTATQVEIRVTLTDAYVDPATAPHTPSTVPPIDVVNGTLSIAVSELKAFGQMLPSGTFTVTSPSFSLSAITAT